MRQRPTGARTDSRREAARRFRLRPISRDMRRIIRSLRVLLYRPRVKTSRLRIALAARLCIVLAGARTRAAPGPEWVRGAEFAGGHHGHPNRRAEERTGTPQARRPARRRQAAHPPLADRPAQRAGLRRRMHLRRHPRVPQLHRRLDLGTAPKAAPAGTTWASPAAASPKTAPATSPSASGSPSAPCPAESPPGTVGRRFLHAHARARKRRSAGVSASGALGPRTTQPNHPPAR